MNITIEFARRDDCLDKMVPSDLRVLVAKRDTLQAERDRLEAKIAKMLPIVESVAHVGMNCGCGVHAITKYDIKLARAALQESEEDE